MEIKELLEDVVKAEILDFKNSLETPEDKKLRVDYLEKLNTMVLKHEELERSKKYDMIDRILTGVDITVKVTAIVVPMVKYDQWFHEGMKFEETGTFVAQTFKSFFDVMTIFSCKGKRDLLFS